MYGGSPLLAVAPGGGFAQELFDLYNRTGQGTGRRGVLRNWRRRLRRNRDLVSLAGRGEGGGVHRGDAAGAPVLEPTRSARSPPGDGGSAGVLVGDPGSAGARRNARGAST